MNPWMGEILAGLGGIVVLAWSTSKTMPQSRRQRRLKSTAKVAVLLLALAVLSWSWLPLEITAAPGRMVGWVDGLLRPHRVLPLQGLSVAEWRARLADPDWLTRWQALCALDHILPETDETAAALLSVLGDEHELVRAQAVHALGTLRPEGEAALQALGAALTDPVPGVREQAVLALAAYGQRAAGLEATLVSLLDDPEPSVRVALIYALERIGLPEISALGAALADPEDKVRLLAALALGRQGERARPAGAALVEMLAHTDDVEARWAAITALGRIGPAAADAAPALLAQQDGPDARRLQRAARMALHRVDASAVPAVIASFEQAKQVVSSAQSTGAELDSAVALLSTALETGPPEQRVAAAEALRELRWDAADAAGALLRATRARDRKLRSMSLSALEEGLKIAALPELAEALVDPTGKLTFAAAVALRGTLLGSERSSASEILLPLLVLAARDASAQVREEVAAALSSVDYRLTGSKLHTLAALLRDRSVEVRVSAAKSLARGLVFATEVMVPLSWCLQDPMPEVRQRCAYELSLAFGARWFENTLDSESWEAALAARSLAAAMTDTDEQVQRRASLALKELPESAYFAGPILLEKLETAAQQHRAPLLEALAQLGPAAPSETAARLLAALDDPDPDLRAIGAAGLGKHKNLSPEGVVQLVHMLEAPEPALRRAAAAALAQLGPEAETALPRLRALLKDTNAHVRLTAVLSLGILGRRDESNIAALTLALQDEESQIRSWAAAALAELGAAAVGSARELEALLDDRHPAVRLRAALTLGALGIASEAAARAAVLAIVESGVSETAKSFTSEATMLLWQVGHPYHRVRIEAAAILPASGLPVEPMLDVLRAALGSANTRVPTRAAQALAHFGEAAAVALPELIAMLEQSYEPRNAAETALLRIGPASLDALRQTLTSREPYRHRNAAELLARLSPSAADLYALRQALESDEPEARSRAAVALLVLGVDVETAQGVLRQQLDNRSTAWHAMRALSPQDASSTRAVAALLAEALLHRSAAVRLSSAEALADATLVPEEALAALGRLLASSNETERKAAARALRNAGPRAVSYAAEALASASAPVREHAVHTLGRFGIEAADAVPQLASALRDVEPSVRFQAVLALERTGTAQARGALHVAQSDGDLLVRMAAIRAGQRLSVHEPGPTSVAHGD
jgi:HEAT repeat protein